jgi:type VI secretion system protein ImpB
MEPISIEKAEDFENVMKEMNLGLNLMVDNKLVDEEGEKMTVDLEFPDLEAFRPESIAEQVPELKKLLMVRHLLNDLKNYVITNRKFAQELNKIIKDESDLENLSQKLAELVSASDSESGSES